MIDRLKMANGLDACMTAVREDNRDLEILLALASASELDWLLDVVSPEAGEAEPDALIADLEAA